MSTSNTNPGMHLEPKAAHHGAHNDTELGHATTGQSQMPLTGGSPIGRQISVTLTPEQFEQLYLQPGGVGGKGDLAKRFGNPTPLGVVGFLLSLTPFSIFLMGFGNSSAASATSLIGVYTWLGGICLFIAGIQEWILGNTFPALVFTSFGGYWAALGTILNPDNGVAASYSTTGSALEGSAAPAYNAGLAVYLVIWGFVTFILLLGSLRTNVAFVCLFTTLDIGFFLVAAGYFRVAEGTNSSPVFIAGGALLFCTTLCGWWIFLSLVLGSTGMPFNVPLGDLSNFLSRRK